MSIYTATILPPRGPRGLPRWGIAALVVLALHIAIGAYIILMHRPDGLSGVPADTVMIDLAPVASSPAQPQKLAAPPQEEPKPIPKPEPKPEPPPPQPPPPEPPPPEPPVQTVPATPPAMTALPPAEQPVPAIIQTPALPPVPMAEVVLPPPVALPPPPEVKPVPDKMLVQKRIERQRKQKERVERRKERAAEHEKATQAARRAAGPPPGAARQSTSSWASEVQARVNAAKRYPDAARARGESGTATLAFTVDASGRVVSARLAGSSGSSTLDSATLAMAHRLGRLPPPPNGRVTLRVRVNYSVR